MKIVLLITHTQAFYLPISLSDIMRIVTAKMHFAIRVVHGVIDIIIMRVGHNTVTHSALYATLTNGFLFCHVLKSS